MKEHSVIAEFIDWHTDKRVFPGAPFTPHDDDQRERLVRAGCLREGNDQAAKARDQINNDGLFDETVDALKEIADKEAVDLNGVTKKADIVAAIRAKRAAA